MGCDIQQYILFAGWSYYPGGGMEDYIDSYDTFEEANAFGVELKQGRGYDWFHVLDLSDMSWK